MLASPMRRCSCTQLFILQQECHDEPGSASRMLWKARCPLGKGSSRPAQHWPGEASPQARHEAHRPPALAGVRATERKGPPGQRQSRAGGSRRRQRGLPVRAGLPGPPTPTSGRRPRPRLCWHPPGDGELAPSRGCPFHLGRKISAHSSPPPPPSLPSQELPRPSLRFPAHKVGQDPASTPWDPHGRDALPLPKAQQRPGLARAGSRKAKGGSTLVSHFSNAPPSPHCAGATPCSPAPATWHRPAPSLPREHRAGPGCSGGGGAGERGPPSRRLPRGGGGGGGGGGGPGPRGRVALAASLLCGPPRGRCLLAVTEAAGNFPGVGCSPADGRPDGRRRRRLARPGFRPRGPGLVLTPPRPLGPAGLPSPRTRPRSDFAAAAWPGRASVPVSLLGLPGETRTGERPARPAPLRLSPAQPCRPGPARPPRRRWSPCCVAGGGEGRAGARGRFPLPPSSFPLGLSPPPPPAPGRGARRSRSRGRGRRPGRSWRGLPHSAPAAPPAHGPPLPRVVGPWICD
ncbi:collagen alpha-1(I) chain-like [Dromiciops gliroides]|uniref:collagen alpha-1(I) chain-like n=1 Tax=Dromiciops gliroides TaxID=33562 RepID=UPI001CC350F0|nr:collagen alpha-1(I) chain-like [Dromiciops gliroides]